MLGCVCGTNVLVLPAPLVNMYNSPHTSISPPPPLPSRNIMCVIINYVLLLKRQKYIAMYLMRLTLTKNTKFNHTKVSKFAVTLHSVWASPPWDLRWISALQRTTWMMGQIATLLAGLVSQVLLWVWWSTIHLFICYSKVCVGISTPTGGFPPSKSLQDIGKWSPTFDQCLTCNLLQLLYLAVLQDGYGTQVKTHNLLILCSDLFMYAMHVSCMLTNNNYI